MKVRAVFPLAIVMAAGASVAAVAVEGDPEKGEEAFVICGTCHTGDAGAIAPDLHGVIGRVAGTQKDFTMYTPALKESGLVLDEENLDKFLQSPFTVVPGTTMAFPVPDEQQRADLIAFLQTLDE